MDWIVSLLKFLCWGLLSWNTIHQLSMSEEHTNTGGLPKIITMPATRNRSPHTSAHCFLITELLREIQNHQVLDGTMQRRDRTKSTPVATVPGQLAYEHLFCVIVERLIPFFHGDRNTKCKLNKGVYTECEIGKNILTQGEKPRQALWVFYFLVREVI